MSWNIAAYVERKNKKGDWELVTKSPVSSYLKTILSDFKDYPVLKWEDLSKGLKGIYKNDDSSYQFYSTTIDALEGKSSSMITDAFTKLNLIIKALGCRNWYSEDGEECINDDEDDVEKLTFPINKQLIDDLQYEFSNIREAGQREALDLILNENIEYGKENRIVIVYS